MPLSREPKELTTTTVLGMITGIGQIFLALACFVIAAIVGGIDPYSFDYSTVTITPDDIEVILKYAHLILIVVAVLALLFGTLILISSILAKKSQSWLKFLVIISFINSGLFGIIIGVLGLTALQNWTAIETEDRIRKELSNKEIILEV